MGEFPLETYVSGRVASSLLERLVREPRLHIYVSRKVRLDRQGRRALWGVIDGYFRGHLAAPGERLVDLKIDQKRIFGPYLPLEEFETVSIAGRREELDIYRRQFARADVELAAWRNGGPPGHVALLSVSAVRDAPVFRLYMPQLQYLGRWYPEAKGEASEAQTVQPWLAEQVRRALLAETGQLLSDHYARAVRAARSGTAAAAALAPAGSRQ